MSNHLGYQTVIRRNNDLNRQTRTLAQLKQQNEGLQQFIDQLKAKTNNTPFEIIDQGQMSAQITRKIESNANKLSQLKSIVDQQQIMINDYQSRFAEFQTNLQNLMKLDKDIHSKLVNPQRSSSLEANIQSALTNLNSGAPYSQIIQILDNIKPS